MLEGKSFSHLRVFLIMMSLQVCVPIVAALIGEAGQDKPLLRAHVKVYRLFAQTGSSQSVLE